MQCSSNSRTSQQDLLDDVRRRIGQLEEAIRQITATKKHLKESSREVKSQIHGVISRQLETLRSREVWLLNQVEVIQHAKEDILRQQQDQLNVALGGLQNSLDFSCLQSGGTGDVSPSMEYRLCDSLQKTKDLQLRPEETPYISFRADVPKLRENIYNFGRVDSRGLPIETAFADPEMSSSCLPSVFEDYGDAEHLVLYKTVEEIKKTVHNDSSIKVNIPKLSPKPEDWLFHPDTTPPKSDCTTSTYVFSPFRSQITDWLAKPDVSVPTEVREGSSKMSITQWLCQMRTDSEVEVEEDDFELISPSSGHPETDTSDSIEVVSRSGSTVSPGETSGQSCNYFGQIAVSPASKWLVQPGAATTQPFHKLKYFSDMAVNNQSWLADDTNAKGNKGSPCKGICTAAPRSLDIENLDQLLCTEEAVSKYFREVPCDPQNWLVKQEDESEAFSLDRGQSRSVPDVQDVCRANETCNSFSDCVCDENCCRVTNVDISENEHDKNVGKADVNFDWLSKPPVSSKNPSHLSCDLHNQLSDSCDWLIREENTPSENVTTPFQLSFFKTISNNPADWLKNTQPSSNKNSPSLTTSNFRFSYSDTSDWLAGEAYKDKSKEKNEKWEEQSCCSSVSDSKWLCKSETSLSDSQSQMFKYNSGVSDWLYKQDIDPTIKEMAEISLNEKDVKVEQLFPVFQNKASLGEWLLSNKA